MAPVRRVDRPTPRPRRSAGRSPRVWATGTWNRPDPEPASRHHAPIGRFGPYPERLRKQLQGVMWRFRTGSRWRDMPEQHGAWQTV
ncbi:transposase [Nonomuraea muscovyensis]|uniref:transposase n=1 Tax=Nonomuraea muscovyensis TaxID=1124761 RepID=UPI00161EDDFD